MPEVENWAKYFFPDNLTFRFPFMPALGLCKAYNERFDVEISGDVNPFAGVPVRVEIPEYFDSFPGMGFTMSIDNIGQVALYKFVDPNKIETARNFQDCFWDPSDFWKAAATEDDELDILTNSLRPEFSVKWAVLMYKAINLLRYVPATKWSDWPSFEYEDKYNTFNFKAPENP